MKTKIILGIMMLLCIQLVSSYAGGDSINLYDEDCELLKVNVTGTSVIDDGEFNLSENCKLVDGLYECSCNIPTVMTTELNTVNDYKVIIDIWKFVEETPQSSGGSSSGGRTARKIVEIVEEPEVAIIEDLPIVENRIIEEVDDTPPVILRGGLEVVNQEPPKKESWFNRHFQIGWLNRLNRTLLGILCLEIVAIIFLVVKGRKNE